MTTVEQWRDVVGALGYRVSDLGRVMTPGGHAMKPQSNGRYGYLKVSLGRNRQVYVHRLVAEAFIGPVASQEVEHVDGNPANNALTNLLIVTHAENMSRQRLRKPLCQRGHAFAEHGGTDRRGRRFCKACARVREARRVRS